MATSSSKASEFALAAVKARATDDNMVTQPQLVGGSVVYRILAALPPANDTPYVTASTKLTVNLPVPLVFFSASLINHMDFTQTYTFPIIKTRSIALETSSQKAQETCTRAK